MGRPCACCRQCCRGRPSCGCRCSPELLAAGGMLTRATPAARSRGFTRSSDSRPRSRREHAARKPRSKRPGPALVRRRSKHAGKGWCEGPAGAASLGWPARSSSLPNSPASSAAIAAGQRLSSELLWTAQVHLSQRICAYHCERLAGVPRLPRMQESTTEGLFLTCTSGQSMPCAKGATKHKWTHVEVLLCTRFTKNPNQTDTSLFQTNACCSRSPNSNNTIVLVYNDQHAPWMPCNRREA